MTERMRSPCVRSARTEPSTLQNPEPEADSEPKTKNAAAGSFSISLRWAAGSIDAIDVNSLSEATNYSLRGGVWLLLCFSASDIS